MAMYVCIKNFLGALAENGRINKTAGVLSAFEKIMSAHRGEVQANVVTAKVILFVCIIKFQIFRCVSNTLLFAIYY